jgi:hypothetical protein
MPYLKTPGVCRELSCTYSLLANLMRSGRLAPPQKDSSGDFVWTPADVERARAALASRRRPQERPQQCAG